MQIQLLEKYKSIPKGLSFDLPEFCVITGKNGSGKSHLLEAMANPALARLTVNSTAIKTIHHVGFNGLNPQVDEQSDANQVFSNISSWWQQIEQLRPTFNQLVTQGLNSEHALTQAFARHGNNVGLLSIVNRVISRSGKKYDRITQDDVLNYASFTDTSQNQLFFSQCALIFKAYHTRSTKNQFNRFRNAELGRVKFAVLTDEEFISRYGLPPWEVINEILARANLPYKFNDPDIGDADLPYRLRLVDEINGTEISVNDLSSGEKVLMSLALAIYNTQEGGSKPEILILDEPDAPLHPQYSKLLIETLLEIVVKKSKVRVIITTHSPSTVAMAPEGTIFEIDRETKIPRAVSNSFAVATLTEGLSFLKISYENKRQIFVESRYDAQYYQRLYDTLHQKYQFEYHPVFLEPHSGNSNCTDVISIVEKLRISGSDLAYGIIDYDLVNASTDFITVLGSAKRYAIENYLLDPIFIGLALIRCNKKKFSDFGILGKPAYTDAGKLTVEECQMLIDHVLALISIDLSDLSIHSLENGFELRYPRLFLEMQGHAFEEILTLKIPQLREISKGRGDAALKQGILQVIEEFPEFLSSDIAKSLTRVLGTKFK